MNVEITGRKSRVFRLARLDQSVEISFGREVPYFPTIQIPNLIHKLGVMLSDHMLLSSMYKTVIFGESEVLKLSCAYFNHPFKVPDLLLKFRKPSDKVLELVYGMESDRQTFRIPISKCHVLARELIPFYRENSFCGRCLLNSFQKVLAGGYMKL
jgi:hypothetical protein